MSEHRIILGDALSIPLADRSVDLVMGSPPYCDARSYDDGTLPAGHVVSRGCMEWVEWMLDVTTEALRVSKGAVVWVAAGVTRDRNYWPACEGLMWEWHKRGGHAYRPCYWHRVGIPGSGGDQWFRADVEYVMCFKREGKLPWTDNTAMGHAPKWAPGGAMSNRLSDGARVNQWGHSIDSGATVADGEKIRSRGVRPSHVLQPWGNGGKMPETHNGDVRRRQPGEKDVMTKRKCGGDDRVDEVYTEPAIANPGTLVKTNVGGGMLGSTDAHDNEAPYPEALCNHFIRSLCPPGGIVLDPFGGSGTTVAAALKADRNGIGMDIRTSQVRLMERRIGRAMRPSTYADPHKVIDGLFTTPAA